MWLRTISLRHIDRYHVTVTRRATFVICPLGYDNHVGLYMRYSLLRG